MNERKLKHLFEAAKSEAAPVAPEGFAGEVLRTLRSEAPAPVQPVSLWEQLGLMLPRVALASAVVIMVCFAADSWLSQSDSSSLTSEASELSEQWGLFVANDN